MRFQIKLLIFLLSIIAVACNILPSGSHQTELQAAYERSEVEITQARRTLDTSLLSEFFTQKAMKAIEERFVIERDMALESPIFEGEETDVDWVEVIEYNPPEAIIKVKYFYRRYTYDRETSEIVYHDKPNRYWRIFKYKMRQEDGIWKVDEALEFVDWSG